MCGFWAGNGGGSCGRVNCGPSYFPRFVLKVEVLDEDQAPPGLAAIWVGLDLARASPLSLSLSAALGSLQM